MDIVIFVIIFILFVVPSILFIKFKQYGFGVKQCLELTCRFPKEIITSHIKIYNILKKKDRQLAISALFAPITQFSSVVDKYSYSYVKAYAKIEAIKELVCELKDRKDIPRLQAILKNEGINLKIKKRRIKEVVCREPIKEDISNSQAREYTFNSQDILNKILEQRVLEHSLC